MSAPVPSERDREMARGCAERIILRLTEGLASIGLGHVEPAPKQMDEWIALHLAIAREEGRVEERERSGWQPIETAPKDGTEFDAWDRDGRITNVYWSNLQEAWCIDVPYGRAEPQPLGLPVPTHWRSLPLPPRAEK